MDPTTRRAILMGVTSIGIGRGMGWAVNSAGDDTSLLLPISASVFGASDPLAAANGAFLLHMARFVGECLRVDLKRVGSMCSGFDQPVPMACGPLFTFLDICLQSVRRAPAPVRAHYHLIAQNFLGALLDTPEYQRWKADKTRGNIVSDASPESSVDAFTDTLIDLREVALCLDTARELYQRFPELVTAPLFPEPFATALAVEGTRPPDQHDREEASSLIGCYLLTIQGRQLASSALEARRSISDSRSVRDRLFGAAKEVTIPRDLY